MCLQVYLCTSLEVTLGVSSGVFMFKSGGDFRCVSGLFMYKSGGDFRCVFGCFYVQVWR